ncbi:MAG: hypothetical protein JWQ02_1558 [Capsulimonas sp.]|nr:hypothetical protein [Capsulimonas sp.]
MKTSLLTTAILILSLSHVSLAAKHSHSSSQGWKDPGVDVGIVKAPTALYVEPDAASEKIASLRPNAWTVLVSHHAEHGWLHVIGLSSGRIGWVRANRVDVRYTPHPNKGVDLPSEQTGADDPPTLVLTNDADRTLFLHLADQPEIRVAAHSRQTITAPAGVCSFSISLARILPSFGDKLFQSGSRYRWRFWIVTGPGSHSTPHRHASRQMKEEARRLQAEVNAETANRDVESQIILGEEDTLRRQSAQLEIDDQDLTAMKRELDESEPSMTDDFNERVDAYNNDLRTYKENIRRHDRHVDDYNLRLRALKAKRKRLDQIEHSINAE